MNREEVIKAFAEYWRRVGYAPDKIQKILDECSDDGHIDPHNPLNVFHAGVTAVSLSEPFQNGDTVMVQEGGNTYRYIGKHPTQNDRCAIDLNGTIVYMFTSALTKVIVGVDLSDEPHKSSPGS